MRILAVAALLSAGCAPGRIAWGTGDDLLRTALYTTQEEDTATHVAILLSNGIFQCAVDDGPDPAENEDARGERCYAARREDARHVVLHLWYPRGSGVEGVFPGDTDAAPGASDAPPRWSRAAYIAIEEVANASGDDLVQDEFVVTRFEAWGARGFPSLGDGGTSRIDQEGEGTLGGSFSYPTARISGSFDADFCAWDAPSGVSIFRYLGIVDQEGRIPDQWEPPLEQGCN